MGRLEEIQKRSKEDEIYLGGRTLDDDIDWLLEEVDRLRAIEHAALQVVKGSMTDDEVWEYVGWVLVDPDDMMVLEQVLDKDNL